MNYPLGFFVATLALFFLLSCTRAAAQTQVGIDYFDQPTRVLVDFDRNPSNVPIEPGTHLELAYAEYDIRFDDSDVAVALDDYGASAPNQATGSLNELQALNVYFIRPVDAVGAWGYDFAMKAFDRYGGLILEVQYTDGRPCPRPANFREQRFLGIEGDRPIYQVQYFRYYQDQVACGFRIDDLMFLGREGFPPPPTITGNMQISWNSCIGTGSSNPYKSFDCSDASASYELVGTIQVQYPFADLYGLSASMDVVFDGQSSVPSFWHLEPGGCNENGWIADDAIPASCIGYSNPWGPDGSDADAYVGGYQSGFNAPHIIRLMINVSRTSGPVDLDAAPARYYGWTTRFLMSNAGSCTGCALPASLRINDVRLVDGQPGGGYSMSSASAGSVPCVMLNDGGTACDATPNRRTTWSRLKSMYR